MGKKICLSIEQMQKLKELGIDTTGASMCWVRDMEGNYYPFLHDESCYEMSFMNPVPAFSFQDLMDLLPIRIPDEDFIGYYYPQLIRRKDGYIVSTKHWPQGLKTGISDNALDAVFVALVWLAENGYWKGGKQ